MTPRLVQAWDQHQVPIYLAAIAVGAAVGLISRSVSYEIPMIPGKSRGRWVPAILTLVSQSSMHGWSGLPA